MESHGCFAHIKKGLNVIFNLLLTKQMWR